MNSPARLTASGCRKRSLIKSRHVAVALFALLPWFAAATDEPRIGLAVRELDRQGALRISWNPSASDLKQALLEIRDGEKKSSLELTPAQVRLGSILYRRTSGEVVIRLQLFTRGEQTLEEYVFFLSGPSLHSQKHPPAR